LARDPEKFAALYRERVSIYELAEARIPIASDEPEPVVEAILAHPFLK
jgi:hypothetical protein